MLICCWGKNTIIQYWFCIKRLIVCISPPWAVSSPFTKSLVLRLISPPTSRFFRDRLSPKERVAWPEKFIVLLSVSLLVKKSVDIIIASWWDNKLGSRRGQSPHRPRKVWYCDIYEMQPSYTFLAILKKRIDKNMLEQESPTINPIQMPTAPSLAGNARR